MRGAGGRYFKIHDLLSAWVRASRVELPKAFEVGGLEEVELRVIEGEVSLGPRPLRPLGLRLFVGKRVLLHRCLSYGDLRLLLVDLLGSEGPTTIAFTPHYRIFREKLLGASIWHFIKLAIMVRLLAKRGHTFVHASGIGRRGRAFLFTGWSDVGKTRTAVELLGRAGGGLGWMSSDITLLGPGGRVLAWPSTPSLVVRPFEKLPILRGIAINKGPILPPDVRLEMKGKLSLLFVLEQGPEGARELSPEEAFRKLVICTDMAFNFSSDLLLLAYSHANPELDLLALREKHLELLREAVEGADCIEIRARGPGGFAKLAREFLP